MNKWKITAIIFIVLFVVETLVFIWAWNVGVQAVENENECAINICDGYDAYYFDSYEDMCYCYTDNVLLYQEYLK